MTEKTDVYIVFKLIVFSMTLSHQIRKWTRVEAALAGDILDSDPESARNREKEKEDNGNLESNQKRDKFIAARIGQPLKSP